MGLTTSILTTTLLHRLSFFKKELEILMVGLDEAGKTTILYKFKLGEIVKTIPTLGYNVETFEYKKFSITVSDIGGKSTIRALWSFFCEKVQGLIYVVDASNRDRIKEATKELHKLLQRDELKYTILLVYANKKDLSPAMTTTELAEELKLNRLGKRIWHIQPTCALEGYGLYEGLDWLSKELAKRFYFQ